MPKPRKPKGQKLLHGDAPARIYAEPEFPVTAGAQPPFPLRGPVAVGEWNRIAPLLESQRVLTTADLSMLATAVNVMDVVQRTFESGGRPTGADLNQVRMFYREFGLTPSSRSLASQVGNDGSDQNEAEGYLSGPRAVG